jgi:hypothetical protein
MPKTTTPHNPATKRRSSKTDSAPKVPRVTKQQIVVDLLKRSEGGSTQQLMDATGWLPHTVRAVISALHKGKSGQREIRQLPIEATRKDGVTVYRTVEPTT